MRVNALLIRYEGGFREASSTGLTGTDGSPLTTPGGELLLGTSQGAGRIEGFVNYPEDSAVEADRKAASTISTLESARWQTTVGIEPTGSGDIPLTHWDVGDTITVPDQDWSPQVVPVIGLLLTEDEAGHPVYRPQVGERIPSLDERRATTNRNFSSGDLGGRDPQAQPRGAGMASAFAAKLAQPAIGGGGSAAFTATVAASDATARSKARADYVCTGTNDHLVLNQAIADTYDGPGDGRVLLSEGTFYCAGALDYVQCLEGVAREATLIRFTSAIAGAAITGGTFSNFQIAAAAAIGSCIEAERMVSSISIGASGGSITEGVLVNGFYVDVEHSSIFNCTTGIQIEGNGMAMCSAVEIGLIDVGIDVDSGCSLTLTSSRMEAGANDTCVVVDGTAAISACFFTASSATGSVGIDNNGTLNSGAAGGSTFSGFGTNIA